MEYNVGKEEQIKNRSGSSRKDELRLTSDLAFKAVFGRNRNECRQALMGLLNAILGTDEDQISELTYINPFNPQNYEDGKLSCMDIKLVTKSGKRISVEMQIVVGQVFLNRSIYYEAQLVTEELDEGEDYDTMNRSIFIGILANNLFEGPRVHRKYRIKDVDNGEELSDLVELHFVELKKADEHQLTDEMSEVEKWALYLKYAGSTKNEALVEELTKRSEMIEMAEKIRREVSKDEELRARAFSRRLFQMDVKSNINAAKREGLEKGLEEGLEKGLQQGQLEKQREIAKRLMEKGMPLEQVCEVTELSMEEIERFSGEK